VNIAAFQNSPSGRLSKTRQGYYAYVPNPLPPQLDSFDLEFLRVLDDAGRAVGELAGSGRMVPNPNFLIIPYTRLEAVKSSQIEGTQASLSELFFFEAASDYAKPTEDVQEVINYLNALNYGLQRLETLPLSLRLVGELHEKLMDGVRGGAPNMTPGEFRRSQNWIGQAGCTLNDATYVPPPVDQLMQVLGQWELFLHDRTSLPVLLQCALMHYQFEAIHPFLDGNGRVGRLMITLFLCERGVLPLPLLYLSAFFEEHRQEYYERLLAVSQRGDWIGWIKFFLRGVTVQSNHASESARKLIQQREDYRATLQAQNATASTLRVLDLVFTHLYLTVKQIENALHISFGAAQKAVDSLQANGIVEEITGQKRNRVFAARQLLKLLDENEPLYQPKRSER